MEVNNEDALRIIGTRGMAKKRNPVEAERTVYSVSLNFFAITRSVVLGIRGGIRMPMGLPCYPFTAKLEGTYTSVAGDPDRSLVAVKRENATRNSALSS